MSDFKPQFDANEDLGKSDRRWRHGYFSGDVTVGGAVKVNNADLADAVVRCTRQRFTVAQVNAGATILPALPSQKYRIVYGSMTAIGGAVTQATTIDILAGATKLFQGLQASLTENAVADDLASGLAPLAAGLTYVAQTAGVAITIGKTGTDEATATHIDVLLQYVIEAA